MQNNDDLLEDLWLSKNPEYLKVKEYVSKLYEKESGCFYPSDNSIFYSYRIVENIVYLGIIPTEYKSENYLFYLSKLLDVDITNIKPLRIKPI